MQESRERTHRAGGLRSVRDARCSVCHRFILSVAPVYAIYWPRRMRVCQECLETVRIGDTSRWRCWADDAP
jgi:hypothetical protein